MRKTSTKQVQEKPVLKIYCDESGYTGRDLLSKVQPYFVYSACHLEDDLLEEIKTLISKYRVEQGQQVKGINFVSTSKGQKAIEELFSNFSKYFRVVYHEKHYALACKIVEYGVEPYLKSNQEFYTSKLNDFIALGLYLSFRTKKDSIESTFKKFLDILWGKRLFKDTTLYDLSSGNPLIEWLDYIVGLDSELLQSEIETQQGIVGKEILDLVVPSLLGLLSEWGKKQKPLSVLCDDCNVFKNNIGMATLNSMGTGKRSQFLTSEIGYKLDHNIRTGSPKTNYGLQVADLVSSSVFYAINNFDKEFSKKLIDTVECNCMCTPDSFCVTNRAVANMEFYQSRQEYYYNFMRIIYSELAVRYDKL